MDVMVVDDDGEPVNWLLGVSMSIVQTKEESMMCWRFVDVDLCMQLG
jgi:hypothetical protein